MFSTFAGFPNPQADDYLSDYDDYDNDIMPINEEEESEIKYNIRFLSTGVTHVVDRGTTIKLPCKVDKYPGKKILLLLILVSKHTCRNDKPVFCAQYEGTKNNCCHLSGII